MSARRLLVSAVLFTAALALTVSAPPVPAGAQTKGNKKGAVPHPPPKHTAFRVQVRHPGWRRAVFNNHPAAHAAAVQMRAARWPVVRVDRVRTNRFVVRARMPQWQDRAVVANRATADSLAHLGQLQGFQARVVAFHHR